MTSEDLAMRVARIEATLGEHEDIRLLNDHISTYHWLADHFRWDEWSALLTEDMIFEFITPNTTHVFRGIREMTDSWKQILEGCYQMTQHVIVNRYFEIADDRKTAIGHANGLFFMASELSRPDDNFGTGGRYEWEFVRTPDGWRTRYTRLRLFWEIGRNAHEELVQEHGEGKPISV